MAISINRYVSITSGVGAGVRVPGRDLGGRIFTGNALVPTNAICSFESAAEVAEFFGSASEEYRRAAFYFGFISKTQTRARRLSFVRHTPIAVPATLRGAYAVPALKTLKQVAAGAFSLTLDGDIVRVTGCDFTGATSYADIAEILQESIREAAIPDPDPDADPEDPDPIATPIWANSTVLYDAARQSFVFTGGVAGASSIEASGIGGGDEIAGLLRWSADSGSIASPGVDPVTVTDALNRNVDQDNNFGSFLFSSGLSLEEMEEAANFAHLSNIAYLYCLPVDVENASGIAARLKDHSGVALTECDPARPAEYPEMVPMILLAATDYTRRNGTINYMFHQIGLTPTVTDNAKANLLDKIRVNYYGRTQQAGQIIDFYQRGLLLGAIQDMNIYANEMWLKDRIGADIMTLLLAMPKISANDTGRIQVVGVFQNVIEMALKNGAISVEKPLQYIQKTFVTTITGDPVAWVQVQSQGWWLNVEIQEYTVDDRIEYKIVYLLIYSKDDVIRKVEGTHSLI